MSEAQPPSGGCVLKLYIIGRAVMAVRQPPKRGSVFNSLLYAASYNGLASRLQAAVC